MTKAGSRMRFRDLRTVRSGILAVAFAAIALSGCSPRPRPTTVPIPSVRLAGKSESRCLFVLLPGIGDRKEDFARHGFEQIFEQAGTSCELIALDSHFGYYADGSIVARLHDDVIAPARERGVERIVLAGISLGGLGAALYARDRPGEVEALVLLAPYLGEKAILNEIERAGGPRSWRSESALEDRDLRRLWVWLQGYASAPDQPALRPPLRPQMWLGFGDSDRLRRGHRMLASLLPADRVFHASGGHTWRTWRRLWREILAAPGLAPASAIR